MPVAIRGVSVYRIRDGIAREAGPDLKAVLAPDESPTIYRGTNPHSGQRLTLAVAESRETAPIWREVLQPAFNRKIAADTAVSTGALLLIQPPVAMTPAFAMTFGTGRRLLEDGVAEPDFGLLVSLNAICAHAAGTEWDAARMSSVDARHVDATTIATRRQASRRSPFEIFDIDVQRDFVRAVSGIPVDDAWGGRISGADACRLSGAVTLDTLDNLCTWLEHTFRATDYREHFSWVDNVRRITDRRRIDRLNRSLVRALCTPDSTGAARLDVAPPDLTDWLGIRDFRFSLAPEDPVETPSFAGFEHIMRATGRWSTLDVDDLKSSHLIANYEDGNEARWSIYRCFTGQLQLGSQTYLIDDGHFYLVEESYLTQLDADVSQVPRWSHALPSWPGKTPVPDGVKPDEGYYNETTASMFDNIVSLDEKLVRITDRSEPVEVCDLLTAEGDLIHVKRKTGASAMSHLFAQGTVSAELLLTSHEFRAGALARLHAAITARQPSLPPSTVTPLERLFAAAPEPQQLAVIYAIAADWKNDSLSETLPFFSKINLRAHTRALHRQGYRVMYAPIDHQSQDDGSQTAAPHKRRRRAKSKEEE
jgi:uncharacterized protein (TIGR04141 family)